MSFYVSSIEGIGLLKVSVPWCSMRQAVNTRLCNFIHLWSLAGKRGVLKRPWSEAERAAVEEHLTRNITELRVPAKADCERCLQQCPLLVNNHRDWRAIKFYCHNRIQLLKKNQRRESQPQPLTVCWEGRVCVEECGGGTVDQSRLSNGTLLSRKCTSFERTSSGHMACVWNGL